MIAIEDKLRVISFVMPFADELETDIAINEILGNVSKELLGIILFDYFKFDVTKRMKIKFGEKK